MIAWQFMAMVHVSGAALFATLSFLPLLLSRRCDRKAAVYQRVVDRCDGSMLTLLAIEDMGLLEHLRRRAIGRPPERKDLS